MKKKRRLKAYSRYKSGNALTPKVESCVPIDTFSRVGEAGQRWSICIAHGAK